MKLPNILIAASIAIGVVACSNIFGGEESPVPYNSEDPLKAGEISLPVKPDPMFSWTPQPGSVNLGGMTSKAGGEPVLMALGGGVAAGYRDGGLFREGQITSYPNLVARQMGLTNFKQPLFERESGNGTGRLVIDKASNDLRWKEVTNNLAYEERETFPKFKPYSGPPINNFSVPGLHPIFYNGGLGEFVENAVSYYKANPLPDEKTNANYLWDKYDISASLASRFMPSSAGTGWDRINGLMPDLGIIDVGMDIYLMTHIRGGGLGLYDGQRWPTWELQMLDRTKNTGMKYVYTTIPDVLDFPYFKIYNYKEAVRRTGSVPKILKEGRKFVEEVMPEDILLPTANVVNYIDGKFEGPLTDADVIRTEEMGRPEYYNQMYIQKWVKDYKHPLVDFYSIYKKVLAGQYVSEDGFRIDPSFPNGNFFSSDGIYPSAIGQAVLANEVIKVFNAAYGMQIPLIKIGDYAAEIARK